ncbi:MAG: lamin tail domain-containing protein [bacterium]|nr:lamin tail domain-containing protein [bacterium]
MKIARRILCAVLLLGFSAFYANAAVVVNELYYDHIGSDTGYEFIELYNNGATDVDISGWQIQWGGTTFAYGTYTLPTGTIIGAHNYLLIGGTNVQTFFAVTPDLVYNFNFQNAGGATDAVRINDLLGYHDTCLYDVPNTNNLTGDAGDPALASEINPLVVAGHSLSRITPGVDNNLATDWQDLTTPTPQPFQGGPGPGITLISDVRANDSTGTPILKDSLVTITGIITCAVQLGTSGPAYMYDNSGAVAVYDITVQSSGIAIGDSVTATGWVGFYAGLTEIVDEPLSGSPDVQFQIISSGHTVNPIVVTPSGFNEAREGYLVRLNGAHFVETGNFVGNVSYHAVVGVDTVVFYVDAQTDIVSSPIPVGSCDLIGQVGQYDNTSPYTSGYQLIPRSTSDLIFTSIGPSISQTMPNPYLPSPNQSVVINSRIYDDIQVTTASVYYSTTGTWTQLQLFDDGLHNDGAAGDSVYGNSIPGFTANTTVQFYVSATDNQANTTTDPANAPTNYYTYIHHDYTIVTPIATLMTNDSLGFPLLYHELFTIEGYVTATTQFGTSGTAHIQTSLNGGPGIAVFDPVVSSTTWGIGDHVKVTGWLGFYNGLAEIEDNPNNANYNPVIEVLGTGGVLLTTLVPDLDQVGESYESVLVEYRGVRFTTTGNFLGNTNYWVTDGADSAIVRIDTDSNIPGAPIPTDPVNVIGIQSQFDSSSPYTTGYQLLPRFTTDIYTPLKNLTLVPLNPPIVIPANGGSFTYIVQANNNTANPASLTIYFRAEYPDGTIYTFNPSGISRSIGPNSHPSRTFAQSIPRTWPAGVYSYRAHLYVGTQMVASDAFIFTKSTVAGDGEIVKSNDLIALTDWIEKDDSDPATTTSIIPEVYSLDQNYPNPFNPTTTIRFGLPDAGQVQLDIYNLQGQLVTTLVNGYRSAGYHEVSFDASSLASGVYLYKLQAGSYNHSSKMVLIK